jgi:hypothetical protein
VSPSVIPIYQLQEQRFAISLPQSVPELIANSCVDAKAISSRKDHVTNRDALYYIDKKSLFTHIGILTGKLVNCNNFINFVN